MCACMRYLQLGVATGLTVRTSAVQVIVVTVKTRVLSHRWIGWRKFESASVGSVNGSSKFGRRTKEPGGRRRRTATQTTTTQFFHPSPQRKKGTANHHHDHHHHVSHITKNSLMMPTRELKKTMTYSYINSTKHRDACGQATKREEEIANKTQIINNYNSPL
jgi:hypothetical protein